MVHIKWLTKLNGSQIGLPTIEWLTFKMDGSLPNIGWLTIKWLTKLNGSPNWMTHKLDGSLLSGSLLNLMAHYQMLDGSLWNGWPNWVADTLDCPLPNIGWLTSRYWITFTIEWLIAHWVLGRTRGAYCISAPVSCRRNFLSAALAVSGPFDFPSKKSSLVYFAHDNGLLKLFENSGNGQNSIFWSSCRKESRCIAFRVLNLGRNGKKSCRVYACCFVNNTVTYLNSFATQYVCNNLNYTKFYSFFTWRGRRLH